MTWSLLSGALLGLGVYALVRVFVRPRPGVATMLARIEGGQRSMSTHTVTPQERAGGLDQRAQSAFNKLADRLEVMAVERGWQLGRQRADLSLMGRTTGSHLAAKVAAGLGLLVLAPFAWSLLRLFGVPLPGVLPAFAAVAWAIKGQPR